MKRRSFIGTILAFLGWGLFASAKEKPIESITTPRPGSLCVLLAENGKRPYPVRLYRFCGVVPNAPQLCWHYSVEYSVRHYDGRYDGPADMLHKTSRFAEATDREIKEYLQANGPHLA